MDQSIFTGKQNIPNDHDLHEALGNTCKLWNQVKDYVRLKYPDAIEEWYSPGEKHGWSFRMKDKKRAILYLLPRDKFFKVAFVFGQKAFDIIMKSKISDSIKTELASAKIYAEGRGIRIEVKNDKSFKDIEKLIDIKIEN